MLHAIQKTGRALLLVSLAGLALTPLFAADDAEKARRDAEKAERRAKHEKAAEALRERIAFYVPPEDFTLPPVKAEGKPRRVIFLIGDGMGPAPVFDAAYRAMGDNGRLYIEHMPVTGYARTYSANASVTDSAAAGTALATGVKTNNGRLARRPDGADVPTLLEAAKRAGWRTGVVSTKEITDATPAAFVAHVNSRHERHVIARQLADLAPDVIMGGGRNHFLPMKPENETLDPLMHGDRKDGANLIDELTAKDYVYAFDADTLVAAYADGAPSKVLGLFNPGNLANRAPEPMLDAITGAALKTLAAGDDDAPFFIMIEGAQIDSAGHANNHEEMVFQTLHFDMAVAAALRFAAEDGDTLVVVTADHDTGGLGLPAGEFGPLATTWSSKQHTALPVHVFAYGPGMEFFAGAMNNIDIPRRIAAAAGLEGLADE